MESFGADQVEVLILVVGSEAIGGVEHRELSSTHGRAHLRGRATDGGILKGDRRVVVAGDR